jgi:hypothetical protein
VIIASVGLYSRKCLLYSQASMTKYSLSEKYAFLFQNSLSILHTIVFTHSGEFFKTRLVREVVVDFP